jgi:ParB family transcriptional regulator, chromosome partitioning protein
MGRKTASIPQLDDEPAAPGASGLQVRSPMYPSRAPQTEREVALDDIRFGPRIRPVGEGAVADLMVSIRETGLIQPIVLRPVEAGDDIALELVAGAHRLEAHRRLGLPTIKARIVTMSDLDARQAEIDENLVRHDADGWLRCLFLGARALVYAERHPEAVVAVGEEGPRGRGRPRRDHFSLPGDNSPPRHIPALMGFLAEVSDQTGLARKTLLRDAQIWAALHPYADTIATLPLARDTRALKQIAAQPPERRGDAIAALADGRATTASEAVMIALGGTPVKAAPTAVDDSVKAFRAIWGKASPGARAAILADLQARSLPKGWTVTGPDHG